ncbi:MAG: PKD domain-containing protein [Bacteroidales bacterium]|nr:PKD domain-containing protein [Bacteroidales bacterium]
MKKNLLLVFIIISTFSNTFAQAGFCNISDPFCTSNVYTFPAGVNTGQGESGPNYGCLGSTPNPAWYHMRIAEPGQLTIKMFSTPSRDIDFICWGPFTDPVTPCTAQLTSNKIVSCSYSTASIEYCNIPNGQIGEYYILLITNYSNSPCNITFEKSGGVGETDCTILPPPIGNNGPLCVHDNLHLTAETVANATYYWTGPNGFFSIQQNPVLLNVGLPQAGVYSLVISVNGSESDPVTTSVVINALPTPEFDFNNACFGDTTFFIDQTTVDPPSSSITAWNWEFGDGQQAVGPDQKHLYGDIGLYDGTLTVYTGFHQCERSITHVVHVNSAAVVNAGTDITIPNGWVTNLDGDVSGGSGSYDILWTPSNLLVDPTIVDPTTVNMGATTVFKLGVTDANSGCLSADSMTVIVTGGALQVSASAEPMVICQDDVVNLQALPSGGSGNNQFTWSSNPPGFTASSAEVSDYPMQTTTYTVSVFDGQNIVQASITVTVKPKPVANAGNDMTITVGTYTTISGSAASAGSGVYTYSWSPMNMLMDPIALHPQTVILDNSQEYILSVHDANGCVSNPDNMYVFAGGDQLSTTPTSSAADNTICQGESVTLFANAMGGGGNYTYTWSLNGNSIGHDPSIVVSPMENTTYEIEVNDSFKIINGQINIRVNHTPVVNLIPANASFLGGDTILVCVRDSAVMDANTDPLNPPIMDYLWSNNTNHQTFTANAIGNWIEIYDYWARVTNPVTGCQSSDTIVIWFDFTECNIGIEETGVFENHVTISPNPTSGIVELKFTDVTGELYINLTDLNGKVLLTQKAWAVKSDSQSVMLNLEKYPAGMYLFSIEHKNGYYRASVIKN